VTHDLDLIGYLEKSISEKERERIEEHIKGCQECHEELTQLERSEALFGKVMARYPDIFCPDSDELVKLLAGELEPEIKQGMEEHIKTCVACQGKMALLNEAEKAHVELPEKKEWEPLPHKILERIKQREKPLRDRLKQALMALKAKGRSDISDLLDHVDELSERIMGGTGAEAPSYALERDITLPSQTDLQLRVPSPPLTFQFQIDDVVVEVKREQTGIRLRLTRQGKPLIGLKIRISRGDEEITVFTDQRGEAFLEERG
jgi:hypothetical protein